MVEKIVFLIFSAVTLASALVVVTNRNLFRSALYLALALVGVAGLFVLLDAGFLAVVQIFIYAGAITILIIFAVMVTRHVMNPDRAQRNTQWLWALSLALVVFVLLLLTLWPTEVQFPVSDVKMGGIDWPLANEDAPVADVGQLGEALVDVEQYALPFEVASVLLLVAMIGAVYIVFPRRDAATKDADVGPAESVAEETQ